MGLGTELPLLLALGFVVFGPKRMQTMLGHVARAKAELHKASRGIKSRLPGEIKATLQDGRNDCETSSRTRHPAAAPAAEIYFTAGPNHGSGGLFGYLTAVTAELTEGNTQ